MRRSESGARCPPILDPNFFQTARCVDKHHHPRGGGPARASDFLFDFAPKLGSVFVSLPGTEGAERRKAHPGCLPFAKDRRRSCETGSPYGAPLRRLKSLGPRFPLTPALRLREGVRNEPWAPVLRREAASKDSRDHDCESWAQAPLLIHAQFRSAERPSVD